MALVDKRGGEPTNKYRERLAGALGRVVPEACVLAGIGPRLARRRAYSELAPNTTPTAAFRAGLLLSLLASLPKQRAAAEVGK